FLRYTFFTNIKNLYPDTEIFYLRPDRGPRVNSESLIWIFQNIETRNSYFPEKDFPTEKYEKLRREIDWMYTDTTYYKYFEAGWNSSGFSSDYEIIATDQTIFKNWLHKGVIMVFQHLKMNTDVTPESFEETTKTYWQSDDYAPEPGVLKVLMKCTRGFRERAYTQLYMFSNRQLREDYFPYEGQPQNVKISASDLSAWKDFVNTEGSDLEGHYEIVY
ncbi:MAG: hypothetical protein AAF242_20540, partial [Bacteroidota bacterium]